MYLVHILIRAAYFINRIGVPSSHDHATERYNWRQSTETVHSFSDPEFLALALMAALTDPD